MLDLLSKHRLDTCIEPKTRELLTGLTTEDIQRMAKDLQLKQAETWTGAVLIRQFDSNCEVATALIKLSLHKTVKRGLSNRVPGDRPDKLWDHLTTKFERKTVQRQINIDREWTALSFGPDDNLDSFLDRAHDRADALATVGRPVSLSDFYFNVMARLPTMFDTAIELQVGDITTSNEQAFLGTLYDIEAKHASRKRLQRVSAANVASSSERKREVCRNFTQGRCRRGQHCRYLHGGQESQGPSRSYTKQEIICWYCNRAGHKQDACRKRQQDRAGGGSNSQINSASGGNDSQANSAIDWAFTIQCEPANCTVCHSAEDAANMTECEACSAPKHHYCGCCETRHGWFCVVCESAEDLASAVRCEGCLQTRHEYCNGCCALDDWQHPRPVAALFQDEDQDCISLNSDGEDLPLADNLESVSASNGPICEVAKQLTVDAKSPDLGPLCGDDLEHLYGSKAQLQNLPGEQNQLMTVKSGAQAFLSESDKTVPLPFPARDQIAGYGFTDFDPRPSDTITLPNGFCAAKADKACQTDEAMSDQSPPPTPQHTPPPQVRRLLWPVSPPPLDAATELDLSDVSNAESEPDESLVAGPCAVCLLWQSDHGEDIVRCDDCGYRHHASCACFAAATLNGDSSNSDNSPVPSGDDDRSDSPLPDSDESTRGDLRFRRARTRAQLDADRPSDYACTVGSHVRRSSRWLVDMGASRHFCNDAELLVNLSTCPASTLKMADNTEHRIGQSGDVHLNTIVEGKKHTWTLKDVALAPMLQHNLLSTSRLDDLGMSLEQKSGRVLIYNTANSLIATADKDQGLFYLQTYETDRALLADVKPLDALRLWHQRLGHLSIGQIRALKDLAIGVDFSETKLDFCRGCAEGKMCRIPFPKASSRRASEVLALIHSDLAGPVSPNGTDNAKYLCVFVDDKTRFCNVYLLPRKSATLTAFKDFKAYAEKQQGTSIRSLRTDNGGEFLSNEFSQFLAENGIRRELTHPNSPQQNGVAERFNRTLFEMARSLLHHAGLETSFWAEALKTAVYIRNRSPTRALIGQTPYEAWHGTKPDLSHMRVFGSKAYAQIHKSRRGKLDKVSKPCTLVGYSTQRKGYVLWDAASKKFFQSRDVYFDESALDAERLDSGGDKRLETKQTVQSSSGRLSDSSSEGPEDETASHFSSSAPGKQQSLSSLPAPHSADDIPGDAVASLPDDDDIDGALSADGDDDDVPATQAEPQTSKTKSTAPRRRTVTKRPIRLIRRPSNFAQESYDKVENDRKQRELKRLSRRSSLPTQRELTERFTESELEDSASTAIHESDPDPETLQEALEGPFAAQWAQAMEEELKSMADNQTWTLANLPFGRKAVRNRWVFKRKLDQDGKVSRYKARLVAKGFSQVDGVDFNQTFAPVAKYKSIRTVLAIAAALQLNVHQMDVATAFLNGELQEQIYMEQPRTTLNKVNDKRVCLMSKAIYGLKQSPRAWNENINAFLCSQGFQRCKADSCLYTKRNGSSLIIVCLYVDDLIIAFNDLEQVSQLKRALSTQYKMTDLGVLSWCLGMRVTRPTPDSFKIDQARYSMNMLSKFKMANCKPCPSPAQPGLILTKASTTEKNEELKAIPYRSAVSTLMYLALSTRPDLSNAVRVTARYCNHFGRDHWQAVKRIMRYVKGTLDKGLVYTGTGTAKPTFPLLTGYTDADWAGCQESRRSTTGYVFLLSAAPISWSSRTQPTVALSTAEAEYMSASAATQEALWLRSLLHELGFSQKQPTIIHEDNQGAIALSLNDGFHGRTKHIAIRHHFIREAVANGSVILQYIPSAAQLADLLTKNVATKIFDSLVDKLVN